MKDFFSEVVWVNALYWLYGLLGVCLLFVLYGVRYVKRTKALALFNKQLIYQHFNWQRYLKALLYVFGVLALYVTFLDPRWGKRDDVLTREGRDIVIALDVSKSMLAQDRLPNRLAYAKNKIKTMLRRLQADRFALILFSGSAFVHCPLTADYATFMLFLDQLDSETISSGTTAVDQALKEALKMFETMPSKKHKLLVLLTDGEDFSSNLVGFKTQAQEQCLTIFSLGLGTSEGAPIPLFDDSGALIGHQRDEQGNIVISRLNEGILRTLSEDTGGRYAVASEDNVDIDAVCSYVESLEREQFEQKKTEAQEPRYYYFALLALIFFLLEWLL